VILPGRTALEQHAFPAVEEEHRHGAVQQAIAMHCELRRDTDRRIARVHEHHQLIAANHPPA
jgi:hypothetical protein